MTQNVLIVGAGISGLTTAASLLGVIDEDRQQQQYDDSDNDIIFFNVTLMEASDRVGGRMRTVRFENKDDDRQEQQKQQTQRYLYQAELGATFVHGGRSEHDDLLSLIRDKILLPAKQQQKQRQQQQQQHAVHGEEPNSEDDKFPLRLVSYDYNRGSYFDFDGSLFEREDWSAVRQVFSRVMFKELIAFRDKQLPLRKFCNGGATTMPSSPQLCDAYATATPSSSSFSSSVVDADQPMSVSLDELRVFEKEKLLSLPNLTTSPPPLSADALVSQIEANRRLFDLFCYQFIVQEWQAPLQDLSTAFFDGEEALSVNQENDVAIVGGGGAAGIAESILNLLLLRGTRTNDNHRKQQQQQQQPPDDTDEQPQHQHQQHAFHLVKNHRVEPLSSVLSGKQEEALDEDHDRVVVFAVPLGILKEENQKTLQHDMIITSAASSSPSIFGSSSAMRNSIADSGVSSVLRVSMCWKDPESEIFWGSSFFGGGPAEEGEEEEEEDDEAEKDDNSGEDDSEKKKKKNMASTSSSSSSPLSSTLVDFVAQYLQTHTAVPSLDVVEKEIERRFWAASPLDVLQEEEKEEEERAAAAAAESQRQPKRAAEAADYTADFFFHKWSSLCIAASSSNSTQSAAGDEATKMSTRIPYADSDTARDDWEDFELTQDDLSENDDLNNNNNNSNIDTSAAFSAAAMMPRAKCARYGKGPHIEFVNMWRLSNGSQPCLQAELEDSTFIASAGVVGVSSDADVQQQQQQQQEQLLLLEHLLFELNLMFSPSRCRRRNLARLKLFQRRFGSKYSALSAVWSQRLHDTLLFPLFHERRRCPRVSRPSVGFAMVDWKSDKTTRGGYFFPRVDGDGCELQCALNGVGCEKCAHTAAAQEQLQQQQQQQNRRHKNRIVFAGEHVYPEIYGNMEGAMLSGKIAADLVRTRSRDKRRNV